MQAFDILKGLFNKFETNVEKYLVCPSTKSQSPIFDQQKKLGKKKIILNEPSCNIQWPHISLYGFIKENELKELQIIKNKKEIRKFINARVPKCVEPARTIFQELIYTIIKFAKMNNFDVKQTGALLSQFYLTHIIFTSSFNTSPEKLYLYFKEFMLCHSVSSPPDSLRLFDFKESEKIMILFCKIYIRNMPLLRILCLPNFGFYLNFECEEVESPPVVIKEKEEKPIKPKGKKKKK